MLNAEQSRAYEIMQGGENIFLTGEAGTGKSFLIRYYLDHAKNQNVLVCAPTGIAAVQIGGATIHSVFKAPLEPILPRKLPKKALDAVKAADIILIDEISMCRFELFDFVCRHILRAEEETKKRKQLEVMRQRDDPEFIRYLNQIRVGNPDALSWFNANVTEREQPGIFMFGTNREAERKNLQEIQKLNTEARKYEGKRTGKIKDLPTSEVLELRVGARVMAIVNDAEGKYQNGSLGTVTELRENTVKVRLDSERTVRIERYTWEAVEYRVETDELTGAQRLVKETVGKFTQLPLKIAFAVTIHKSQGQTYDSANLDPACFSAGQLYVALSRVTSVKSLHLLREIRERDLRAAEAVNDFYGAISV